MLTEDEQLRQAFERGKQALGQKQDSDAALRAAYEKYHPAAGGGAAINEGSATRSVSPGATIGSIVGGVAGGVITAPTGGGGAIPGAIAGAALGELAQQGYDRMTNSAYAPSSIEDSAKRIGTEAGYAAAGELGARAITFLKPVSYAQPRALTADQQATKAFMDRHQIPYTPDQITGGPAHAFMRSIADNGIFSEKDMSKFAGKQNEAIRASATAIADTMGRSMPPDVLGQQVIKTIRNEDDAITQTVIQPLYNRIADDLKYTTHTVKVPTGRMVPHPSQTQQVQQGTTNGSILGPNGQPVQVPNMVTQPVMVPEMTDKVITQGGLLVDQRPLKQLFQKEVMQLERTAALEKRPDLLQSPHYQSMKRFANMPDEGQWADAHLVLKETRKSLRELDNPMNIATDVLQDKAVLTRAEQALETQLQTSLQNSANPAHQADLALWSQAQNAVKVKNERLKNDVVLRFIKAIDEHGGEQGMKTFVNNMTPEDTAKVMTATSSAPAVQASLRRSFLEDKIIKAGGMADAEAPFDAERFRKVLFGKDEMNARKSAVMLDAKQQAKLKEFTNAVSDIQQEGAEGKFGSVFIRMKSSGALFSVPIALYGASQIGGGDVKEGMAELGAAASILIAPNILARMLTNPRATEYMIQGLRYSATDRSNVLRITRELMRLDQGFAQAVRAGVSAYNAEQTSGPIHRGAEDVRKGVAETTQSVLGLQP